MDKFKKMAEKTIKKYQRFLDDEVSWYNVFNPNVCEFCIYYKKTYPDDDWANICNNMCCVFKICDEVKKIFPNRDAAKYVIKALKEQFNL